MESKLSLRTPRQQSTMHGLQTSLSRPSTMQSSWSSQRNFPTRQPMVNHLQVSQNPSARPHTTGGESRSRKQSHSDIFMDGTLQLRPNSRTRNVAERHTVPDHWASSKAATRPQTAEPDQRRVLIHSQRLKTSSSTVREKSNAQVSSKTNRPHTATENLSSSAMFNDCNQMKKFHSVKSYCSPRFTSKDVSPPESPRQSIFDARCLKYPENWKEPPKFGMPASSLSKAGNKPPNHLLDPTHSLRSPSISIDFKVDNGNPMESLVTQMPVPPTPTVSDSTPSITPSTASRMLRKQIEAALRMYPRNTWGPVTKWGYQEELIPGQQQEKAHFTDKDRLEKQRLESRTFGHKRHWVKFKDLTNLWEPHEARQSAAYADEKERFLTDSGKMLHIENQKRIARANGIEKTRREKNEWREFKRLEAREGEYINRMETEQGWREDGRTKSNDSGVVYNIVNLEYPNNYAGDLLRFDDAKVRWRQCMRALRLQSKQSGARMYNVLSWKPHKPCCVPPERPEAPQAPDPKSAPSPRKPMLPLPRNMLHLEDRCDNVPVGCNNDMRTNW